VWRQRILLMALLFVMNPVSYAVAATDSKPLPVPLAQDHWQGEILVTVQPETMIQLKDPKAFQRKFLQTVDDFRKTKGEPPADTLRQPHTFYCAAFVQHLYRACGIWIPAHTIYTLPRYGIRLNHDQPLQTGDLVFFNQASRPNEIAHVGVYLENGIVLHPEESNGAFTQANLRDPRIQKRLLFATRIVH
jgi:hypothetical protein